MATGTGIGPGRYGLTLRVSAPGVDSLGVSLSRFESQVVDFTPYWQAQFLPAWRAWITEAFRSEGRSTGAAWAPWSPRYAAWRRANGFAGQGLLVRSGSLSASLINPERDALGIWRPSPSALDVGTRRPFAIVHQLGSRKARIPARPPIRPTQDFVTNTLGRELQRFVAASWSAVRQTNRQYPGA